jgi:glycosyltransferase involved in cell wall biosynthesis
VTRAVAYFGTYDPNYPRNAVLIDGLREHGVTVHEFQTSLPSLPAAEMATPAGVARLAAGVAVAHLRLLAQHRLHLSVDAIVVGYPGYFLVPFGRALAAFRHARLVFDPLVSLWDTFAGDRGLVAVRGWKAGAIRGVDRVAFTLPDLVLADTREHAAYFQAEFGLSRREVVVVPVGARPEPRADGAAAPRGEGEPVTVFQYGKWSPMHGAETVLAAADFMRERPVRFVLAGEGQLSVALRGEIARRGLSNVAWLGALSMDELRTRTLGADVCLGVFGASNKAARVVPNKVYDALACGRPIVTADTAGIREALHDGEDAVLVPAADGRALAAALERLLDEGERSRLGAAALVTYRRAYTPAAVAGALLEGLADA